MLKTFVLLGCFLEEQWWISGIRYGSCSNWFVEVSFHLINQVFCFWLILFFDRFFFTSYAGNHQGVQKVAFHQQYAPQQIGLDQWQQLQDTSWSHWSTSKSFLADSWPACVVCNKDLCWCYNHCLFDNPHLSPSLQAWGSGTWILNIEIQIRNRCHGNTAPLVSCHKRVSMFP